MSQAGALNSGGSGGSGVQTLTGNTGGAVGPTGNNINIVGTGTISVAGNPGTSTLTISSSASGFTYTNVNHAASPYTVLPTDQYISVDCSAGTVSLLFPNAPAAERTWVVKDRTGNSATNNITITTVGGSVTIDGSTSYVINENYEAVNLLANSTPTYEVY